MQSRQEFVNELMARVRGKVDAEIAALEEQGPVTIDQIEEIVEQAKVLIGEEMAQRILDRQTEAAANCTTCPACKGRARFHSWVRRVLLSRHGELKLTRRWYRCICCGEGFAPLDRQLGLGGRAATPWVQELLAEWGAERSFEQAVTDLARSRGLVVGASTVERIAVALGQRLRQAAEQEGEAYEEGTLPAAQHQPRVLYLSMDGVYAPLRDAWTRDGSAGKLVCRGGECKVGMAYEIRTDRRGQPRVAWREYTATFADIEAFRPQMAALAHRCGVAEAETVVFLADTLACNWNLAADYFPNAVQIVDFRHARDHIKEVEVAFFGTATEPGQAWRVARTTELWEGGAAQVAQAIRDLPVLPHETATQAEIRRREAAYFETHQERMRYPTFREKGYQIGSGVMEASCRTVVNQRLDCSGMHWRQETADSIVALRAALLSTTRPNLRALCTAS